MNYISHYLSPVGPILLRSDGVCLTGLCIEGQRHFPMISGLPQALPVFQLTEKWLDAYFSGEKPDIQLPLHLTGTPFQTAVWQVLQEIPYGHTTTYGEIARKLGCPKAAQAVGGAVGRNPISIIVPCHRVVGSDGSLTGYAGGMERKIALLELENGTGHRRTR